MNIFSHILPVIATITASMSCLGMQQYEHFNTVDVPREIAHTILPSYFDEKTRLNYSATCKSLSVLTPSVYSCWPTVTFKQEFDQWAPISHSTLPKNMDTKTRRNYSATCTSLRKALPIEKTEEYQKLFEHLSGQTAFRIVRLSQESNDDFVPIWEKNYRYIQKLFEVADATMTPKDSLFAKRLLLEATMPNSRSGAKDWMGINLLRSAVHKAYKTGDDKFATDLIKANPHNFCHAYPYLGESEMVSHITTLAPMYITNAEARKYVELANKQIYTPLKKSCDCTIL